MKAVTVIPLILAASACRGTQLGPCESDTARLSAGQSATVTLVVRDTHSDIAARRLSAALFAADHRFWSMPRSATDPATMLTPSGGAGSYTGLFTKTGERAGTLTIGRESWTVQSVGCA